MEKQTVIVVGESQRFYAAKVLNALPAGWVVEFRPPKRSDFQNRKLHAMCGDFSKQMEWARAKRSLVDWKRLLVDGHGRASGIGGYPVCPSLDYTGVVTLGELTRDMSKSRMADVISFSYSYGDANGIKWSDATREAMSHD